KRSRALPVAAGVLVLALVGAGIAFLALRGDDGRQGAIEQEAPTTTAAESTSTTASSTVGEEREARAVAFGTDETVVLPEGGLLLRLEPVQDGDALIVTGAGATVSVFDGDGTPLLVQSPNSLYQSFDASMGEVTAEVQGAAGTEVRV